jgi:hypothetical protein
MLIPRIAKYKRGNAGVPDGELEQDVESIKNAIDKLGKYPAHISGPGLLIIGHVTKTLPC